MLEEETIPPASILSYLDSLPEVQQQLDHVPLTSCVSVTSKRCTTVDVVVSASCTTTTSGNLTRTLCTELTVPVGSTRASVPAMSTDEPPIMVPRKPAAYLTYNTLTLSETTALPDGLAPEVTVSPTHPNHQQSVYDPRATSTTLTQLTATLATESGTKSAEIPNRLSESGPSVGSPTHEATVPASPPNDQDIDSDGDGDSPDTPREGTGTVSADTGNLWSAIQSLASHVAISQGQTSNLPPEGSPGVDQPAGTKVPQQGSDTGNSQTTHHIDSSESTGTGPIVSDATTDKRPVFTFRDETLSPGSAATFGGNPVSALPGQDGVIIDGTRTVLVSDGQVTTIQNSGLEPLTISRSGSLFVVDGNTLSPDQQITAGQTIVSLAQSTGVLYVNGAATTLAGPSITIGGTVYTAATATPTSAGDLGGYIYSGIGGSAASERSAAGSGSGTGSASFTGAGSRTRRWDYRSWAIVCLVLCLF